MSDIVRTIDNEVVVKLKDGSHHSIMFKDEINSHKLKQFFEELLSRKGQVTDTKYVGDMAIISLSEAVAQ